LVSANKPANNLGYERLEASLERPAGTVIKTTIETGDEATVSGFALISSFEYNRKGSMHADRLRYLEITLSEWLFRAIDSMPFPRQWAGDGASNKATDAWGFYGVIAISVLAGLGIQYVPISPMKALFWSAANFGPGAGLPLGR
jgi:Replication initiator protein A